MMNAKTYRVWLFLLKHPNREHNIKDVAYMCNLTDRQVFSILSKLETPLVQVNKFKVGLDKCTSVIYSGTPEETERIRREVIASRFNITAEIFRQVNMSLSSVGWMTISSISDETGLSRLEVSHALDAMEGICTKTVRGTCLYRKESL